MSHQAAGPARLSISFGEQQAAVVAVGGALESYAIGDRCLIESVSEVGPVGGSPSSRGAPLLPWPNRIADGRYRFDGTWLQLPISEVSRSNAIHGLTLAATWDVETRTASSVELRTTIEPQPGYPFRLSLSVVYALGETGLMVTTTARNDGSQRLPYGAGHHPWLRPRSATIDDARLVIPARSWYPSDERLLPLEEQAVVGTDRDFRSTRSMGSVLLDSCYTGFHRDPDGRTRTTLDDAALWMDEAYGWLMVYTGDGLSDRAQRRRSLAIEPMTCPPNAFRTGIGLIILDPGQQHVARWGIDLAR